MLHNEHTKLLIRRAIAEDYETLVALWLRSVRATHRFLTEKDIASLLPDVWMALRSDQLELWVSCVDSGIVVGFMGLAGQNLEALFLDPAHLRRGIGRRMVAHAIALKGELTNEYTQNIGFTARVGPRWYHSGYERVVRFVGVGITGNYTNTNQSPINPSRAEYWSAGAYGELGLQYLFTRHLGLGVRGDVSGSWSVDHFTQNGSGGTVTQRNTGYHIGLEPLQIIGTFYF